MILLLLIMDQGIPSTFSQKTVKLLDTIQEVVLAEVSKLDDLVMNIK